MSFAFVQSTDGSTFSGTSVESDPLAAPPTAGNVLVAYFGSSINGSDDLVWPDGWLYIAGRAADGHGEPLGYQELRYKLVEVGDPDTVAVDYPVTSDACILVDEYSFTGGELVITGSHQTWDNLNPVLWSINPPAGLPALMVAVTSNYNGANLIPTGFTLRETETPGAVQAGTPFHGPTVYRIADRIVASAAGPYTDSISNPETGGIPTKEYVRMSVTFGLAEPVVDEPAIEYDVYKIDPPGNSISYIATLDDAFAKAIRPVRNEPGSGQFVINRNSPNATAEILTPGHLLKVRIPAIGSDHIFAFFMEKGDFNLISANEEGGEDFTFGGLGGLSYWSRAIWLSEKFAIPWWDPAWGTPPAGARGHVTFEAGKYRRYTIAGGVITGYTWFTTAGFEAYFDSRQTYQWPSASSKRFLVHIMAGETHAGWYVHPHQDGVTETLPSPAVGTSSSVLLSDISSDTPGAILYRLFLEGADPSRPTQPIPLMTIDFTDTTDSNGDPWATTDALAGLTAELGETYLDTIAKLLSTGVIDVEMGPNLDMHAYNSQGRDLTGTTFGAGKVRFVKGVNIADELRREREDNPVATFIEVVGTDNVTGRATLPDAASRVAREASGTGDSDVEAVLEALGLASLNAGLIKSDAIGFRIATGDNDAAGLYLPGPEGSENGDFWLGDVVTLHTGTGEQDFDQEDERVFAITITEDEAGNLEVTPEVGSVLGEAERRLYANTQARSVSFTSRSQFSDTDVAEPQVVTAADVAIDDADGWFAAIDVEAALAELAAKVVGYEAHGNMGATETFDAAIGWHSGTFNANCTFTLTGATSGLAAEIILELLQDGTGGRTMTLPASVINKVALEAAQVTTAGTTALLLLLSRDGGTTWYGFWAGGGSTVVAAEDVTFTPAGAIAATDVQAAIEEVATEAAAALAAHAALTPTGSLDHAHVVEETHTSDGSTTTFNLAQFYEPGTVAAYNLTSGLRLTVIEVLPDQATISAAGSAGNLIGFDYAAQVI